MDQQRLAELTRTGRVGLVQTGDALFYDNWDLVRDPTTGELFLEAEGGHEYDPTFAHHWRWPLRELPADVPPKVWSALEAILGSEQLQRLTQP